MDGGRIFRSLLSMRLGREKATRIASMFGQIIAVIFLIWGVYRGDFILSFIGVFVFFSAANEFRMVRADHLLTRTRVQDILRTNYTRIYAQDPMQKAIDILGQGSESDFIVVNQWHQMVGVLHEEFIREAEKKKDTEVHVREYMSPNFEAVPLNLDLKHLFHLFQTNGYSIIPVFSIGNMIGVVDRKTLNDYIRNNTSIWQNWRTR